jgi:hypothetical protein
MNHAICLQCGTGKAGALATCPRCGFKPQKTEEKAKSVLLSDKCAKMPMLEKVGKRIASGEKLKFDDADVLKWSDLLDSLPKPPRIYLGLTVRMWTIIAVALGGAVAMGVCATSWMELR